MYVVGTVKSWWDGKGYGFVIQDGVSGDIFVHHSEIRMEGRRTLNPGQRVRFRIDQRERGRSAKDVEVLEATGAERCHACGQELQK